MSEIRQSKKHNFEENLPLGKGIDYFIKRFDFARKMVEIARSRRVISARKLVHMLELPRVQRNYSVAGMILRELGFIKISRYAWENPRAK